MDIQAFWRELWTKLIDEAGAQGKILPYLPKEPPQGRVVVVGAGKAAASMAQELERVWPFDAPLSGYVITRYGHGMPTQQIKVLEAAHPVPDAAGEEAARRLLQSVRNLHESDWVIALLSGGASALMALPQPGVSLEDKRAVAQSLLRSGAPIEAMNTVRKRLSLIKGGRLAQAAAPAQVLTLAISDVVGDDIATIGSGPTVPDPTTLADVQAILTQWNIHLPDAVRQLLLQQTPETDTPKALPHNRAHVIVTPDKAFQAASAWAKTQKWRGHSLEVLYLGDRIAGEAREVAAVMAGIALHRQAALHGPLLMLSGGETTVSVRNSAGKGGRNTEFLLALALALQGAPGIYAFAADTDGIDGSEDNAGAFITPDTLMRARAHNLDAAHVLNHNNAYDFFNALDDLWTTGPTRTNINDMRAILIEPKCFQAA